MQNYWRQTSECFRKWKHGLGVLIFAGQALQKPAGIDVPARLSRLIASDRQMVAKARVAWPDWPSNRTWVDPSLVKRPRKPHSAGRALRHETSL